VKPGLSATRALRVLSFLTVNPRSSFTLSELSDALQVTPSSMSSVLLALVEAGYLTRHPRRRTYELGVAAVALGNAAALRHPVVEAAGREMPALAALGSSCVGSAVVGEEIAVLAIAGRATSRTREVHLGQRMPLVPPYGQAFLAWSPSSRISRWLETLGGVDAHLAAVLEGSLRFTREHGHTVVLDTPAVATVQSLYGDLAGRPWDPELRGRIRRAITDQADAYAVPVIDADASYAIDHIAAPVFGVDGDVVFVLTVHGVGRVTGRDAERIGRDVAEAGLTVTREIGGRAPADGGR
jgi:DNA-binding IclR family transcriptional regulator